ncbi:general stress protein 26 [Kribbella aluminosa]|uniref:General stress protein 26 n=1 Tax=Kribbella aluminosa TaxID=416017 RepID=A0ABS4UNH6_9ACTN|nr:pyridoxamine 5'-phosphate oxidase family protein [Kribbella aluminosa]MBP2353188.1 general stress protein 26 [Kribbella aluminosa]
MSAPETTIGSFSTPGAGAQPWEETEGALRRIQKFQLCTVRLDGRPHVTPLLAIWAYDALWFTTGAQEQKVVNLKANQYCTLTTGTGTLAGTDYVVEGTAAPVADQATRQSVATAFEEAYGWHFTRADGTFNALGDAIRTGSALLYKVVPTQAFAFTSGQTSSQTRYRWPRA